MIGRDQKGRWKKGVHGKQHNQFRHGHAASASPTYQTWSALWQRTTSPRHPAWNSYGGSAVSVDVRWRSLNGFRNFLWDMGERPRGTTLGRYLDRGNYEVGNCAWQSPEEQSAERLGASAAKAWHNRREVNANTLRRWRRRWNCLTDLQRARRKNQRRKSS